MEKGDGKTGWKDLYFPVVFFCADMSGEFSEWGTYALIVCGKNLIDAIRNVRWIKICPGVFYIFENFLKSFLPDPNIWGYPNGIRSEREIRISLITSLAGKEVNSNGAIFFQQRINSQTSV